MLFNLDPKSKAEKSIVVRGWLERGMALLPIDYVGVKL